jgi:hypothetical protein
MAGRNNETMALGVAYQCKRQIQVFLLLICYSKLAPVKIAYQAAKGNGMD